VNVDLMRYDICHIASHRRQTAETAPLTVIALFIRARFAPPSNTDCYPQGLDGNAPETASSPHGRQRLLCGLRYRPYRESTWHPPGVPAVSQGMPSYRVGDKEHKSFKRSKRAYEVLSDPGKRRASDASIDRQRQVRRAAAHAVEPLVPSPHLSDYQPEPLMRPSVRATRGFAGPTACPVLRRPGKRRPSPGKQPVSNASLISGRPATTPGSGYCP
jgi:hypothetical protein